MLQCGGGNNTSAALLKEFFVHERKCEDHFKRTVNSRGAASRHALRGNPTGILPLITNNTDIASLRRSPRKLGSSVSPRGRRFGSSHSGSSANALTSPRRAVVSPFDLPHQGIGYNVPLPENTPDRHIGTIEQRLQNPSHGRRPPYGRRDGAKAFADDICGGGIACLHPAIVSRR